MELYFNAFNVMLESSFIVISSQRNILFIVGSVLAAPISFIATSLSSRNTALLSSVISMTSPSV